MYKKKNDRQTMGEKVYCQKGNNLNQKLRSLKKAKWERGLYFN